MEESILNFNKQFGFEPVIVNNEKLKKYKHFIVCGMGGSHLATGLLKMYKPGIELYVHRNYGLPPFDEEFMRSSLLIASSHSGNTEEVISFLEEGYSKGYDVAVISTGGKIIDFAENNKLPYIKMPNEDIQPRSALGYSFLALSKMMSDGPCCESLKDLEQKLDPSLLREAGEELAKNLDGKIPIIYSSSHNLPLAYNWKIKFNETAKIPAFYNIFPELNHNEMAGFGLIPKTEDLSKKFHFIFIYDPDDHPKIQKRMNITEDLYEQKGLPVTKLTLNGNHIFVKIFNSLLLADWTAVNIANNNGSEPEEVKIIEDLKKKLN